MPTIAYFPSDFGAYYEGFLGANGTTQYFDFTWDELVHAAITFGKAPFFHLTYPVDQVEFEEVYRASIIRANLIEVANMRLSPSDIVSALDPTEKGFISYFLGMTFAKLFASSYLEVPWLMHVDVYGSQGLGTTFTAFGKEKPDLIGLNFDSQWVVMEAKGRSRDLPDDVMLKAKRQTRRLRLIGLSAPVLRVALASYVDGTEHKVQIADPEAEEDGEILPGNIVNVQSFLRLYYQRFVTQFRLRERDITTRSIAGRRFSFLLISGADIMLGIDTDLLALLRDEQHSSIPNYLRRFHESNQGQRGRLNRVGPDGIVIILGNSWAVETMRQQPQSRPPLPMH